jgi:hypothetical protein
MWSFPLCSLTNTTVQQCDRLLEAHWTGCIFLRQRKFSSANIIFSSQSKLWRSSLRKARRKRHNEIALNWILGLCRWNFVFMWFGAVGTGHDEATTDVSVSREMLTLNSLSVWSSELNIIPTLCRMLLQITSCPGSGSYSPAFHTGGLGSILIWNLEFVVNTVALG